MLTHFYIFKYRLKGNFLCRVPEGNLIIEWALRFFLYIIAALCCLSQVLRFSALQKNLFCIWVYFWVTEIWLREARRKPVSTPSRRTSVFWLLYKTCKFWTCLLAAHIRTFRVNVIDIDWSLPDFCCFTVCPSCIS